MKLKITNKTAYTTRSLRRLIVACLRHDGLENDRQWYVEVRYRRPGGVYGHGAYNTGWFEIRLERPERLGQGSLRSETEGACETIHHELLHCLGVKHAEYGVNIYHGTDRGKYGHVLSEDLMLKIETPKHVSSTERRDRRYQHAVDQVRRFERRLKLAKTLLSKWKTKVWYYERVLKQACSKGADVKEGPADKANSETLL